VFTFSVVFVRLHTVWLRRKPCNLEKYLDFFVQQFFPMAGVLSLYGYIGLATVVVHHCVFFAFFTSGVKAIMSSRHFCFKRQSSYFGEISTFRDNDAFSSLAIQYKNSNSTRPMALCVFHLFVFFHLFLIVNILGKYLPFWIMIPFCPFFRIG
jgi:hypothetical protein